MNRIKILSAYIKMFRFYNLFLPGACGLTGALITSYLANTYNIGLIFSGTIIPVLFWGSGQVVNNYCDQHADMINKNQTSMVKGEINSKKALYVSFFITSLLIIISFMLSFVAGVISVIGVVAYCAYCIKLKGIPFIGNTWFGFATSLCVLFGSAISIGMQQYMFYPIILCVFILNGIFQGGHVLIGYFKDIKGDEIAGYRTLCVLYKDNLKFAAKVTLIYSVFPVLVGVILWIDQGEHYFMNSNYLIFQIISLIISIKAQKILINDPSPQSAYVSFSMHKYSVTIYFLSWLASFISMIYAVIIITVSVFFIWFGIENTKTSMQL